MIEKLEYTLEAILFANGEPVSVDRLCSILEINKKDLQRIADRLEEEYSSAKRGITLLKLEDSYQLATRPEYANFIRDSLEIRKKATLGASSMEVLAIIAYKQPVTKVIIEQLRGVDCTYTVSSLLDKELIESCGKLDVPGKPTLYRTTSKFLRSFTLSSLSELPNLPNLPDFGDDQIAFEEL